MSKTINEALRDLFLAHGGDASDLEDNKSLSDFIADVSTVLGSNATGTITPALESGTKIADFTLNGVEGSLYAPSEVEFATKDAHGKDIDSYIAGGNLIGTDLSLYDGNITPVSTIDLSGLGVLPSVTASDNGKILAVVDGAWTLVTVSAEADLETGAVTFTFTPDTPANET